MIITTINVAEVVAAIEAMLKDDGRMQNVTVERGEPINEDPNRCPWVGIYPTQVPFTARTLGLGGGYRQQRISLAILCQQADQVSGANCQDRVGELVQAVTSVLLTDPSLKGQVDMLEDFVVNYPDYRKVGTAYMQTAAVELVGVVNVRGG